MNKINNNITKNIYIYRHGEVDMNLLDITLGQNKNIKTKFTEKGNEEILKIANSIPKNRIEIIYTSDMSRAYDTGKFASTKYRIPLVIDKNLRGLNMGIFQGEKSESYLNSTIASMCFTDHTIKFPNGESIDELVQRLINFLKDVSKRKNNNIAVISHSAAISNLYSYLTNKKYTKIKMLHLMVKNNEIHIISCEEVEITDMKNNIIMIRHGENIVNNNINNDDLPLSKLGIIQSKKASLILKDSFDFIICSNSLRAIQTAEIINYNLNKQIIIDNNLIEKGWGSLKNDGSETLGMATKRLYLFFENLNNKYMNKTILLVTHGSLIKLAQNVLENKIVNCNRVYNCMIIMYDKSLNKRIYHV